MSTAPMKACPMCDTTPKLAGLWQFQVRCPCGACGPKMRTEQEAVSRWNSVVHFVAKFREANAPGDSRGYKPLMC